MKQYTLTSSNFASAPGMLRWAISGAKIKSDRVRLIRVISQGWGIPLHHAKLLVLEQVPYTIDTVAETVYFEVKED